MNNTTITLLEQLFEKCVKEVKEIIPSSSPDYLDVVYSQADKIFKLRKQFILSESSSISPQSPTTAQTLDNNNLNNRLYQSDTTIITSTPPPRTSSNSSTPSSSSPSSSTHSTPQPQRASSTINQINVAGGTNTFHIK